MSGDVNLDNLINVVDITLMVSIILYDEQINNNQFLNADMDDNQIINISDIVALVNIILS